MLSKSLELSRFSLTSATESWKLEVVAAADFKLPSFLVGSSPDVVLYALSSRQVWASRARGCQIHLELLIDGEPMEQNDGLQRLRILGERIRDAKAWHKIPLSTTLELPVEGTPSRQLLALIHLKQGMQPATDEEGQAAWLRSSSDVKVPDAVVVFEFETLRVQFNFVHMHASPMPKRTETSEGDRGLADAMLLDCPADMSVSQEVILEYRDSSRLLASMCSYAGLEELGPATRDSEVTTGQITSMFHVPSSYEAKSEGFENTVKGLGVLPMQIGSIFNDSSLEIPVLANVQDSQEEIDHSISGASRGAKGRHPLKIVKFVRDWLLSHPSNPYPMGEERQKMKSLTGLKSTQLSRLLYSLRQKLSEELLARSEATPDEKLLSSHDDHHVVDCSEELDDEMLFSQSSSSGSLTQASFGAFSPSSASTSQQSVVHDASDIPIPEILCYSMADVATSVLFGGAIDFRRLKGQSIQLSSKPPLSSSLSHLVPIMFCPGFKQSVAQNTNFLPTISHALSISLPRNVQTPSLKRKLFRLACHDPLPFSGHSVGIGESGTADRLSSVIQAKLWAMTQRKVYDKVAGHKVWRQALQEGSQDKHSDFQDLFDTLEENSQTRRDIEHLPDDEIMLFSDQDDDSVLLEDGEDADGEKRATELETDEMLFGSDGLALDYADGEMLVAGDCGVPVSQPEDEERDMLWIEGEEEDSMLM